LNLDTYEWSELKHTAGIPPRVEGSKMVYKDGSLYIWGSVEDNKYLSDMHKFEISSKTWSKVEVSNKAPIYTAGYGMCVYKEHAYVINGYDETAQKFENKINRINLDNHQKEWELFDTTDEYLPKAAFGFACNEDAVYLFAGQYIRGNYNILMKVSLEKSQSRSIVLSRPLTVPTARYGHAMTVYDEKLYILGGVGKDENE
jgi:N-acetylneuraminic acid mutarotase